MFRLRAQIGTPKGIAAMAENQTGKGQWKNRLYISMEYK
jgi:hypothetical protein